MGYTSMAQEKVYEAQDKVTLLRRQLKVAEAELMLAEAELEERGEIDALRARDC